MILRTKTEFLDDQSGPDLAGKISQGTYLDLKKSYVYPYLVKIFWPNVGRTEPAKKSESVGN